MIRNTHTTHTPGSRSTPRLRSAFTLIELMVVIIIIGILMAILLPVISRAVENGRTAEVTAEMSRMESAITQFENRFGVQPPSGIVLYESGSGDPSWATDTVSTAPSQAIRDLRRRSSRALIRQIWPDFNFGGSVDINGNGTADVLYLNGAECLVFFLGGVKNASQDSVVGFAASPLAPLAPPSAAGNRIGPFHEFDPGRLVDVDNDGMFEYLDPLSGQQTPMLFLSSYGGRGYQPFGMDGLSGAADTRIDDEVLDDSLLGRGPFAVYYTTDVNKGDPTMFPDGTPWNQNTYQLISPGRDNEFGHGGEYTSDFKLTPAQSPAGQRPLLEEQDNITNFRGQRLGI